MIGFIEKMTFELRSETDEGFSQRLLRDRVFQAEETAKTKIMTPIYPWGEVAGMAE